MTELNVQVHVEAPPRVELVAIDSLHSWAENPRKIDRARLDNLKRSMQGDPNFLKLRPILALTDGTVYAGNQRLKAAKELGMEKVWAVMEDVDDDTMKARALRDNNQWGEWEPGELAKILETIPDELKEVTGFAAEQLSEILLEPETKEQFSLPNGDKEPFQQMTFTLHDDQVEEVKRAMEIAKEQGAFEGPNENSNGNCLARICETYNSDYGQS